MGSGKSTIGRRLAQRLGIGYIDADAEIEEAAGCSIEDIFTFHGEEAFRDGERRVIKRLLDGPAHVLAAGGGASMASFARYLRQHAPFVRRAICWKAKAAKGLSPSWNMNAGTPRSPSSPNSRWNSPPLSRRMISTGCSSVCSIRCCCRRGPRPPSGE